MKENLTATFFEVKARYTEQTEDGKFVRTTENYAVKAVSFSDAEKTTINELINYANDGVDVLAEKIAPYKEVLLDYDSNDLYKVKVELSIVDTDTAKERKVAIFYLVQSFSVDDTKNAINELYKGSASNYEIVAVTKTNLLDVILTHDKQ